LRKLLRWDRYRERDKDRGKTRVWYQVPARASNVSTLFNVFTRSVAHNTVAPCYFSSFCCAFIDPFPHSTALGMSVTTLEEVFIKVAESTTTQAEAEAGRAGKGMLHSWRILSYVTPSSPLHQGYMCVRPMSIRAVLLSLLQYDRAAALFIDIQ
jgi:hypothetical protein